MERLDTPIRYAKGIGPRRAESLRRIGIETLEDALYYLPKRYEDRRRFKKISELDSGGLETVLGEVIDSGIKVTPRKRMKIFELAVHDGTGVLVAKWFNQPFMQKVFSVGQKVILTGNIITNHYRYGLEIDNPEYEILEDEDKDPRNPIHTGRIVPIYRATEGISPRYLRTIMKGIIDNYSPYVPEFLPEEIIERYSLPSLSAAIREAHFPENTEVEELLKENGSAHRRLIFDELFLLELGLALRKGKETVEKGIAFKTASSLIKRLMEKLPYKLTAAQERTFEEIKKDMSLPFAMNRLLQGDVGSGKTIVALQAMLIAVENGYQAAIMAPTEILSEQHYINTHRTMEELGLKVSLLTKSLKGKGKDETLKQISDGKINIAIGTHALIQEGVRFKALGLAVIDEQHRFGVIQRAALRKKGTNPDILVMTATPIPRTLSLTLYGDLDVSVIDELPPGRRPVETRLFFEPMRSKVYLKLEEEIKKGRQAYVVYPLIEESEKIDLKAAVEMSEKLKVIFPHRRIALIHGRIKAGEREEIMDSFKNGNIDILVSTTVIEVGVDVPNATVMVIEHAERFGLSQLHQLRGRVGRGASQSYCFLLSSYRTSEEAGRRLQALVETNDGFRIAEEDLAIRGPGEFFGTKQSGLPDLKVANIIRDSRTLETARKEAFALSKQENFLKSHPALKDALERKWKGNLGFALN